MKHALYLLLIVVCVTSLHAQQVTNIQGSMSLEAPRLNIQGSTARIVTSTNFYFYSFPVNGPSSPLTSSNKPDPSGWAPTSVTINGNGNAVYLPFIDYSVSAGRHQVRYVMSPDGGTTWSGTQILDTITTANSITLNYDNIQSKVSSKGNVYCVWRNETGDQKMYLAVSSSGLGFGPRMMLPMGDSLNAPENVWMEVVTIGGTDNLFLTYHSDSALYVIRSTNEGNSFGAPKMVAKLGGMFGYFSGTKILGNASGRFFIHYGFWAMGEHIPGQMPVDNSGTVVITSTDFGSTWTLADTISRISYLPVEMSLTSTGTLVSVIAESANVNVRSSLNGKDWSAPVHANPTPYTATGKYNFGFTSRLVDNTSLAVAWIDTTTGYDEIFYRKLTIPTPPVTGVEGDWSSVPQQFTLEQNYPNPFNPTTVVSYQLSGVSEVDLRVFDLLGREVAVLAHGVQSAGKYSVTFDASHLTSGTYICRLTAGMFSEARRMMLVK